MSPLDDVVSPASTGEPLLRIRDLTVEFGRGATALRAVDGVSLSLDAGRTLCVVGESGSGKSVTALSIARLLAAPPAAYPRGGIWLEGREVLKMNARDLRRVRGGTVSYVFQEPGAALNPVFRVGDQIKEALRLHRPAEAHDDQVIRWLTRVGIPAPEIRLRQYPHELSGGMQQRIMIAMALAPQPKLLIADEPTTALDVTVQAQIVELLRDLQTELGMAILLITHNLGLVSDLAQEVAVMYAGQIVEAGPAAEVLERPAHPYTRALINSVPALDHHQERLATIPGGVPALNALPGGCRFHPRCGRAQPECSRKPPAWVESAAGRGVRCPFGDLPGVKPSTAHA